MASYTPPTETLPIFDNAVFNSVNGNTVLTVSTANLLYLRKTYADTATALETFNAGIATNLIKGTTTTSNINIATTMNTASLNLGSSDTTTQNMSVNIMTGGAVSGSVNIGSSANSLTVYSTSSKFNNGIQAPSFDPSISGGSFNIAVSTPPATINLGTDTSAVTTAINIGNTNATVNCTGTLKMASTKNITLKTDGTFPTSGTQLGGVTSASILSTVPVSGSVYGTITIPTAGIYLFTFGIYQNLSSLGTTNYVNIAGANTPVCNYGCTNIVTLQIGFVGTQVIQATASNYTLTLSTSSVCLSPVNQGGYFQAIRIG